MNLKTFTTAFATTAVISLALPAFAQDKTGLNVDDAATGAAGGVATFGLAQDLYAMGVEMKDALMVVTAAKMAAGVELTDAELEKETSATETSNAEEADVADAPVEVATMIATAKDLAGGDETIMGLIEDVEAEGARGRIGGASRFFSRLPVNSVDRWKIPFYGQSFAEVGISGDGDAPLAVVITDEGGNRVYCNNPRWDQFYCSFTPRWNGYFYVTVANNGRKRNSYYLLTN